MAFLLSLLSGTMEMFCVHVVICCLSKVFFKNDCSEFQFFFAEIITSVISLVDIFGELKCPTISVARFFFSLSAKGPVFLNFFPADFELLDLVCRTMDDGVPN